ncbi:MAG: hypothetical protein IT458_19485 [Planctomycetes bacterium]|nr:hypothetical protein [Planctomycetota bacterium]
MDRMDFEKETKWCARCNDYVRYLMSVNHSYCVQCGSQVKLFSREDMARFTDHLEKRKWKVS